MTQSELPFDQDASAEEVDYDVVSEALHRIIDEFVLEHELPFDVASIMLLEMSISLRMIDYVVSAEKPSGAGLKLELDRFRRDFVEIIRNARKGAEEFVATAKQSFAAAEAGERGE